MKKYYFSAIFALFSFTFSHQLYGQVVNCPLNTPEFPFETQDDWWGDSYSWSAGLYMPSQIGGAQTINSISYRLDNTSGAAGTYNDIYVYLRHTAVTNYASSPGYPGTGGFTQVYNGSVVYPGTNGTTITITFSTPFVYNGTSNLEVLFENRGGHWDSAEPWFDRTDDAGSGVYPGKVGAGGTWAIATGVSSNRQFNLAIFTGVSNTFCGAYPLAVTLKDFSATCEGNQFVLDWETASEKNNDYFLVDYSEDGTTWTEVGRIDGNGSTTIEQKYSFNHRQQSNSTTYYRLTQVDFDGTQEILRTISANCTNKDEVVVSPNPTNGQISVFNVQKGAIVTAYSALGTQLSSTVAETNFVNFDLSNHPAGVYFINVQSENNQKTLKVTLQ